MKNTRVLTTLGLLLAASSLFAKTYNIQDLGADVQGKTLCTQLINESIQKATREGGGTIYFPAGTYLTAAIRMESNITIDIASGAVIKFTDQFDQYLPFVKIRWEGTFMNSFSPLFYADGAENITITGRGTIDGQGKKWWDEMFRIRKEAVDSGKLINRSDLQKMWAAQNSDFELRMSDNKSRTPRLEFYRPPFIQFMECKNILIEGIKIINSPFWTINPVGCDGIVIHGVTIENPLSPNTDGIDPSSCKNLRISDCIISVGDDCVCIKSGRDKDGRNYGKPCENITITNCVMLAGHGGVVMGSEMSGGIKNVTISNCVFDGTDAGIRVKSTRGRGGVVENIRVDNIVMKNIKKNAFIFNLFYDKGVGEEPVSDRTPIFRNIHISNVTGTHVASVGFLMGLNEMPVEHISFSNITIAAEKGFTASKGSNLTFDNVEFSVKQGVPFTFEDCDQIILNNIKTNTPVAKEPVVELKSVTNILINNCFPTVPTDLFYKSTHTKVIWGNNFMNQVKTIKEEN